MPRPQTEPPDTFAGRIGAEIRRRREQKNFTVEDAARRARVPVQSWYNFEKGKLLLERLPAIAKALGCKVRLLIPE